MKNSYVLGGCPVCAAREASLVSDRGAAREEVEALWADVSPSTAVADTLSFTQSPPLALVRCAGCGLLYRNPRERDVRALYEAEAIDEVRLRELRALQLPAFTRLVRRLTTLHGGVGRGLEVGSYTGAFLAAAAPAGWHFHGTDVNPRTVAFLEASGYDVSVGGIEECTGGGGLDVVACWNTFEQLPDPLGAARSAHALLRPGGLLALRVPNGSFYLKLRPLLHGRGPPLARALLARHNFLGFPYRHGFTASSLRRLLVTAGFVVVSFAGSGVLPHGGRSGRWWPVLERSLRPWAGAPWLEVFARRR